MVITEVTEAVKDFITYNKGRFISYLRSSDTLGRARLYRYYVPEHGEWSAILVEGDELEWFTRRDHELEMVGDWNTWGRFSTNYYAEDDDDGQREDI